MTLNKGVIHGHLVKPRTLSARDSKSPTDMEHHFVLSKIVATLGPATSSPEKIAGLVEAGARVFRVNFSHGTFDEFRALLDCVRVASTLTDRYIAVLGDLSGPKIRIDKVVEGGIILEDGEKVIIRGEKRVAEPAAEGESVVLGTNRSDFVRDVKVGQRVFIDDGNLQLTCLDEGTADQEIPEIVCEVIHGGKVTSGKGVNLPDTDLSLPSLTDWDIECLEFAVEAGFDYLALSFVRTAEDVRDLKSRLRDLGARPSMPKKGAEKEGEYFSQYGSGEREFIPVVAKIEKPQAMECLDEIVEETDIVMVARGDLGVEMNVAEVPVCQKRIIRSCQQHGKPVIVATQMLQSMVDAPVPTRAEASDVANAIFEGADAVMLSGETAVGRHPEKAVQTMRRIAKEMNNYILEEKISFDACAPRFSKYRSASLARGVKSIVSNMNATLIVMWSQHAGGASYMAQNKLPVPIVAFSSNPAALRRMSVLYGVVPRFMDSPEGAEEFVSQVDEMVLNHGWAEKGDAIIMVMGEPFGQAGVTNNIRVHYVGDI